MNKKNRSLPHAVFGIVLLLFSALLFSACATKGLEPTNEAKIFFPEPPEPPRIQFLRSYTGSDDIEPPPSAFDSFVTGQTGSKFRLLKPYGISAHDGKIYICDTNLSLMVFDLKQKKYHQLQGAKGMGKLIQPLNVSIDRQGNKYVSDPVRGQVVVYDRNDYYVKSFGEEQAWKPVDAVTHGEYLYVVDAAKETPGIKVFHLESGKLVNVIGNQGQAEGLLGLPSNIAIDTEGTLYVTDAARFQIVKYDRDGHYLGAIGGGGQSPGRFARPRGVAVDKEGRIYVVDAAFDNVQIFTNDGQLLMFFGGPGQAPGKLYLPAEVYIDYENVDLFQEYAAPNFKIDYLVFVVSQFGDELVNVYGYGRDTREKYPTEEELLKELQEKVSKAQKKSENGSAEPAAQE